jgi:phospholipid/cholesterol/gamma-HCH transport system substrate-binding protein
VRRIIRKHARDFAAIVGLFVVATVVGGFILAHQRLTLPGWVPFVGKDFFELRADFSTAQAVTPGQGQTVDIAGVKVGEISRVDLVDGRARVTLRLEPKYAAVYRDATMLLRPKTGLKDMIVELDPGTATAGRAQEGQVIPVSQTRPDINFDEILAELDGDTRDYLKLLLGGAGEGLRGRGQALSATLRRLDPTARDLEAVTGALSERRANLRRLTHNFSLLASEVGVRDRQLTDLVSGSNQVFGALAAQERRLREAVGELPSSLAQTQDALLRADLLARELGPALQALRPGARALAPSLRRTYPFLRDTTPVVRDQLRPFARTALPVARRLNPTVRDLATIAPRLTAIGKVANYLLNTLAYNPPGSKDEGYLFWLGWANHNAASVFANQDAHGPIRHGLILASCSTLGLLPQIAAQNDLLATIIGLVNLPLQNANICPKPAGPGNG